MLESSDPMNQPRLLRAFMATCSGLAAAFRSERSFRQEVALLVVALPVAFVLTPDAFRRAELIACLLAVLAVELLNTSLEKLCDRLAPLPDERIGIVKDMGSAAVFAALCMAGVIWIGAAAERFG
jgi:diacylglycerol kinase (ATP)